MSSFKKVDYNDFVVEWTRSDYIDDFLRTADLTYQQAKYHEAKLRKHGVKLKFLRKADGGLDKLKVAQLNSLINKHSK